MTDYKKYINALRKCAKEHEKDRTFTGQIVVADLCRDTADLLEELEQEPRWIPVSDGLPEEHEWIGTKRFGTTISDEVYVTFEGPKGERFCEHLSFQNGKISPHAQRIIDAWHKGSKPIAWKPFPEPYEGDKE